MRFFLCVLLKHVFCWNKKHKNGKRFIQTNLLCSPSEVSPISIWVNTFPFLFQYRQTLITQKYLTWSKKNKNTLWSMILFLLTKMLWSPSHWVYFWVLPLTAQGIRVRVVIHLNNLILLNHVHSHARSRTVEIIKMRHFLKSIPINISQCPACRSFHQKSIMHLFTWSI